MGKEWKEAIVRFTHGGLVAFTDRSRDVKGRVAVS